VADEIFADSGISLPLVRSYSEAADVASHWLADDNARLETVDAMRSFLLGKYSAERNAERIMRKLEL